MGGRGGNTTIHFLIMLFIYCFVSKGKNTGLYPVFRLGMSLGTRQQVIAPPAEPLNIHKYVILQPFGFYGSEARVFQY